MNNVWEEIVITILAFLVFIHGGERHTVIRGRHTWDKSIHSGG